jgi:putative NADH-flavin reductase
VAYLTQTESVLRAVHRAGVSRLVAVSSYVALRAPDGRTVLEAEPAHPYFRPIEEVYPAQASLFRAETELDWLLVAPPAELYPYGDATRRYRVAADILVVTDPANPNFKETSVLSMEDLAAFIVDEVEQPAYHRQLVTLAY